MRMDPVVPPVDVANWMYIFANAVGSAMTPITDVFAAVIPVALPVGGVFLAVRRIWRSSKSLTA